MNFKSLFCGVLIASSLMTSTKAVACSWIAPPLVGYVLNSEIVVVGTVIQASETTATLAVESYLKGEHREPKLLIDNQVYDTGPSCTPLTPIQGNRFSQGQQILMFLDSEPQSQLWYPIGVSDEAAFPVQEGRLLPGLYPYLFLKHDHRHVSEESMLKHIREGKPVSSLAEAKDAIANIAGPSVEIKQQKTNQQSLLFLLEQEQLL
ncbi:hypothetical protein C1752_00651 [Acaryochloris thomasi RCC1774]|uniref:Uncharacterized protein n=1 Tax=Acaryochloris thomasi RCC1774 TaxID=1764569 RepID=A0A2W1JN80_9CYAN|nr:hypothetical protein [Acaryochloris thomasi]PZD74778.1 hypothetical protein C1752_00651 [Acaryochloris thomasi RCC1774]